MNDQTAEKELNDLFPLDLIGAMMITDDEECESPIEEQSKDKKIFKDELSPGQLEEDNDEEAEIDNIGFQPKHNNIMNVNRNMTMKMNKGDYQHYNQQQHQQQQHKSSFSNFNPKVRFFSDASLLQSNYANNNTNTNGNANNINNTHITMTPSPNGKIPLMNKTYIPSMFNNNSLSPSSMVFFNTKTNSQCLNNNNLYLNNFNQHNIYQGMGFPMMSIPVERKLTTDFAFYNGLNLPNNNNNNYADMMMNMSYQNNYFRKNTSSNGMYCYPNQVGNNVNNNICMMTIQNNHSNNDIKTKGSYNKGNKSNYINNNSNSGNKTSTQSAKYSGKLNDFIIDKYEIEEFQTYLNSLPCAIHEHIYTQKGSKEIQKYLLRSPSECRMILINSLKENMSQIMIDQHGNYFTQQFIKTCTSNQILQIISNITKDFISIAKNTSGTHTLQALIQKISTTEEEQAIISCIRNHNGELAMAYDPNAAHVLLEILQHIPEDKRKESTAILINNIYSLSFHQQGICIVKMLIGTTTLKGNKKIIIKHLTDSCIEITQDIYGNFGIQKCFEVWDYNDYTDMIDILVKNICSLSMQKYSSCVVEKLIELLDNDKIGQLIKELFKETQILSILMDQFGKFVLPVAVKKMNRIQKDEVKITLNKLLISSHRGKNKLKLLIECLEYE